MFATRLDVQFSLCTNGEEALKPIVEGKGQGIVTRSYILPVNGRLRHLKAIQRSNY